LILQSLRWEKESRQMSKTGLDQLHAEGDPKAGERTRFYFDTERLYSQGLTQLVRYYMVSCPICQDLGKRDGLRLFPGAISPDCGPDLKYPATKKCPRQP